MTVILLLQGGIPAVSVWINKQVIDEISLAAKGEITIGVYNYIQLLLLWTCAIALNAALNPWITVMTGNLADKIGAFFTSQLMAKADEKADLSLFDNPEFYDKLQVLQSQANNEPVMLANTIVLFGRQVFTVVALFALLFPISPWIPLLLLVTTLPQAYISFGLQQSLWKTTVESSALARKMTYSSSIMLTNIYAKEVRLFGLGPLLQARFWEAFWTMYSGIRFVRIRQALWTSSLSILSTSGNAIAFYWVVRKAVLGDFGPGNVLLFLQSLAYIQENLANLVTDLSGLYGHLLYMQSYFAFINLQTSQKPVQFAKPVPLPFKQGVSFEKVSFSYPAGQETLRDISFVLKPGETVALVGENGAGKSTIVKLLSRLYDPTSGLIKVDNYEIHELDLKEWRDQLAVVFQDFCRYSFSVEENIALGNQELLDNEPRIKQAAESAGAMEFVCKLESAFKTQLGKQFEEGAELSGGEWQKLALARAFARKDKAQLLILDEPTSSLDPRSEYEVYRCFAELARGKTTLLITHRLAVTRLADRILVLKNGRLVEDGTHASLLACNGEYAALWRMQTERYGYG
jgi:ATP-binding cassette subfamily B protein